MRLLWEGGWYVERLVTPGAHDPEPLSSILALGVNPVPLLVIFRTPRGFSSSRTFLKCPIRAKLCLTPRAADRTFDYIAVLKITRSGTGLTQGYSTYGGSGSWAPGHTIRFCPTLRFSQCQLDPESKIVNFALTFCSVFPVMVL